MARIEIELSFVRNCKQFFCVVYDWTLQREMDPSEGIYRKVGIIGWRWLLGRVTASRFLCAVGPRNLRDKTGCREKWVRTVRPHACMHA
jgi:hypothetical protein